MMQLWIVCILLMITNAIGTFAYSSRLAGVRVGSINNSGTLYNALTLFSRLSNMFLLPLIGVIVEQAIKSGDISSLTNDFRLMLLASAAGVLIASLMIPTMTDVFEFMIYKLKEHKSLVKVIRKEVRFKNVKRLVKVIRLPKKSVLKYLNFKDIPKGFLVINIFVACVYSMGFLAALYSGALIPEYRLVSSNLSSAINGFATISLFILVDPIINVITDEVLDKNNKRTIEDLKKVFAWMSITKLVGILLAQIFFIPVAHFITIVAQFFI